MTVLWTALIVIGLLMIALAVWPSIRDRGRPTPADATDPGPNPEGR